MGLTTITNAMVSVNAIQGTLIADNAITAVHIATNAVSGTLVADNAITATHIAQNVITVTQLADDAVEADKIADGVITTNHLNSAMISSQTEVAVATGDFVLLGDTSDSNALKKAPISSILAGTLTTAAQTNITSLGTLTGLTVNGAAVFNENSADVDFRVESNGNANMLFVDGGNNRVGVGTGTLNREFTVSKADQCDLAITAANNQYAQLCFGDPEDDNIGVVGYNNSDNSMQFIVNASERMRIDSSGHVLMGSASHADDILYLTRSGHNKMLRFYSGANESGWIGSYTTGALMIGSGDVALTFRTDSDSIYPVTDQVSGRDNAVDLGHPSVRFDDIYATNGTIQTSDRNEKNTITDSDLGLDFVKKLTPKSYKYNGKTRTHYGLVAQDVETVLSDISKPTENFAGFIKSDTSEEGDGSSYRYGLRYHEFIAPMLKAIQELSTELETAKARIKTLEDA